MNILGNEYRIKEITFERGPSWFIGYECHKFLFFTYWKKIKFYDTYRNNFVYYLTLDYTSYEEALAKLKSIVAERKYDEQKRKIKQIIYYEYSG